MVAPALHLAWANPVRIQWGAGCFQSLCVPGPLVVLADRAALGCENETLLLERLGPHCKAWSWFQGGLATVTLAQSLCDELWPVLCAHPGATVLAIGGGSTLDLAKVVRYGFEDTAAAAAGWRSNSVQTALAHALSYELTLTEQLPHGEACAVWLPMAWELALGHSAACDAALSRVAGVPAAAGAQALRIWLQACGIAPRDLRDSAAGRATLEQEMRSARGRNFIASR